MTSFSLDPAAVDRLRADAGAPTRPAATAPPTTNPTTAVASTAPAGAAPVGWFEGDTLGTRARSFARRVLAPAERRMQAEVARAVERHDTELSAQVEQLRAELIRTRTAHAAELAALHEQLRGRR